MISLMPAVSIVKGAVVFAATHRPCLKRCNVCQSKQYYYTHSYKIAK